MQKRWVRRRDEHLQSKRVDLLLAASRINVPPWATDWSDAREAASRINRVAKEAIELANAETHQGELNAALDVYFGAMSAQMDAASLGGLPAPDPLQNTLPASSAFEPLVEWAAAPGQTAVRIHAAIDRLQHFHASLPPFEVFAVPLFEAAPLQATEWLTQQKILPWMPWEYARTMRLIHLLTIEQLYDLIQSDSALEVGVPIEPFVHDHQNLSTGRLEQRIITARDRLLAKHRTSAEPADPLFPAVIGSPSL